MAHCSQYSAITRNYLHSTAWDLRGRTGYSGQVGIHGGQHSLHFNSTFWGQCSEIMRILNIRVSVSNKSIDFIGDIGAGFCKTGYHGSARALDISQVRFTNGTYIDTNYSWRGTTTHRRWYVGLAAQCRLEMGTVLTAWYNAEHQNHIHIDNGSGFVPVKTTWRSDTVLIQAACNYLNGESLGIDGVWGSGTEAAYKRLLGKYGLSTANPKTNAYDAGQLLGGIAQNGLNGQLAGQF